MSERGTGEVRGQGSPALQKDAAVTVGEGGEMEPYKVGADYIRFAFLPPGHYSFVDIEAQEFGAA